MVVGRERENVPSTATDICPSFSHNCIELDQEEVMDDMRSQLEHWASEIIIRFLSLRLRYIESYCVIIHMVVSQLCFLSISDSYSSRFAYQKLGDSLLRLRPVSILSCTPSRSSFTLSFPLHRPQSLGSIVDVDAITWHL